jgi:hypothetical protein
MTTKEQQLEAAFELFKSAVIEITGANSVQAHIHGVDLELFIKSDASVNNNGVEYYLTNRLCDRDLILFSKYLIDKNVRENLQPAL